MAEDLRWHLSYDDETNEMYIRLLGSPRQDRPDARPIVSATKITIDAPKNAIDKEIERIKAELLERYRTVSTLIEKHNDQPADPGSG